MADHASWPLTADMLRALRCTHADAGQALESAQVAAQLAGLPRWRLEGKALSASFECRDWWDAMAFVNALAWLADRQDHHPDIGISGHRCTVNWTTHSAGGITLNDFICAAATDTLFDMRPA